MLFDTIAPTYDTLNHLFSLGIDKLWRKQLVGSLPPCENVLDVAIGTGDVSGELLKRGKAKHIIGLDLSTSMMALGRKKYPSERITWVQGSALQMPFEDNRFDTVVCAYGIRNFSDVNQGLREMYRVCKSTGEIRLLEFVPPTNRLYDWYLGTLMPFIGGLVSGDKSAYQYLYQSVKQFLSPKELCERLSSVGVVDVRYRTLFGGMTVLYSGKKE